MKSRLVESVRLVWLVAWVALHRRWRDRRPKPARILLVTFVLIALGVLATYPPLWGLL